MIWLLLAGMGGVLVGFGIGFFTGEHRIAARVREELELYYGGLVQHIEPDPLPAVLHRVLE